MDNIVLELGTLDTESNFTECLAPNFHDVNSSQAICLTSGMKVGMSGDTTVKIENT